MVIWLNIFVMTVIKEEQRSTKVIKKKIENEIKPLNRILLIDVDAEMALQSSGPRATQRGQHPIGLLYLASAAQESFPDIDFRIFHTLTSNQPEKDIELLLSNFTPDLIGLRALSVAQDSFKKVVGWIRILTPTVPIIAGGPYPSASFNELLPSCEVDLIVIGEGESAFVNLIKRIREDGILPMDLSGTAVLSNEQMKVNSPQPVLENLNTVPFPDYNLLNLDDYTDICTQSYYQTASKCASIYASRGCPYNCFYCHQLFGKSIRKRSAENVVAEMREHVEMRGIKHFDFVDDIFNVPKDVAKETLSLIAKELPGVRLNFPNGLRADQLDEEILDLFEEAGTVQMSLALETASPRLQKMVGKNLNVDRARKYFRAASERFIVRLFCMIGFPTETYEEAEITIRFVEELDCVSFPILSIVRVFEGTSLFNVLQPTKEEALALLSQEHLPCTPKFLFDDSFYGNIFPKEKVPLKSRDINELRLRWVKTLNNPQRVKHAHQILQKYLNTEEIIRFYRVYYDNPKFDESHLHRLLNK